MTVNVYQFDPQPGESPREFNLRALQELDITFNGPRAIQANRDRGEVVVDGSIANAEFLREAEDVASQPVPISSLEFIERLNDDEIASLDTATNAAVVRAKMSLLGAIEVIPGDAKTTQLMDAVVAAGIVTQTRAEEILSGNA